MFLTLGSFWYLYKDVNELFKPNVSKWMFFHSICPIDDRIKRVDCVRSERTSEYCRQDSVSDCNFYLLLTRCDTRIQRNQVSAVKVLNASGRGLWWEGDYLSMPCSGGGVYANVCAWVTSSCPSDPKQAVFGAWLNKQFVYNEEDVLSYETCRMFNGTKTPLICQMNKVNDLSCYDPFKIDLRTGWWYILVASLEDTIAPGRQASNFASPVSLYVLIQHRASAVPDFNISTNVNETAKVSHRDIICPLPSGPAYTANPSFSHHLQEVTLPPSSLKWKLWQLGNIPLTSCPWGETHKLLLCRLVFNATIRELTGKYVTSGLS